MTRIRRATLATKLLVLMLPTVAALALAWTAMAPAQDGVPVRTGHVALELHSGGEIFVFREIVQLTSEAVAGEPPKRPSIVLRRGLSRNESLWKWHEQLRDGSALAPRDATLTVYDARNARVASWRLEAARPTKMKATTLKASGNEVAIETIELAAERLDRDP